MSGHFGEGVRRGIGCRLAFASRNRRSRDTNGATFSSKHLLSGPWIVAAATGKGMSRRLPFGSGTRPRVRDAKAAGTCLGTFPFSLSSRMDRRLSRFYNPPAPHGLSAMRYAQVAQLVEHATENRSVGGSTPSLGTI